MAQVFKNSLKTFESDITGETVEYKVNNMVWLYLESKHNLTQMEWSKGFEENQALYGSYFITGVLKGNGYDVTYKQVLENTDLWSINQFVLDYQMQTLNLDKLNEEEEQTEDEGE